MTTTLFYDSTDPDLIPNGVHACLYGNGPYSARHYDGLDRFASVLWIDVQGDDWLDCSILDVETFDATPADVPEWVRRRAETRGEPARIYCNLSTWPTIRKLVAEHLPWAYRKGIRYWIANPTGTEHLVPGSAACQWQWEGDYDVSACRSRWY